MDVPTMTPSKEQRRVEDADADADADTIKEDEDEAATENNDTDYNNDFIYFNVVFEQPTLGLTLENRNNINSVHDINNHSTVEEFGGVIVTGLMEDCYQNINQSEIKIGHQLKTINGIKFKNESEIKIGDQLNMINDNIQVKNKSVYEVIKIINSVKRPLTVNFLRRSLLEEIYQEEKIDLLKLYNFKLVAYDDAYTVDNIYGIYSNEEGNQVKMEKAKVLSFFINTAMHLYMKNNKSSDGLQEALQSGAKEKRKWAFLYLYNDKTKWFGANILSASTNGLITDIYSRVLAMVNKNHNYHHLKHKIKLKKIVLLNKSPLRSNNATNKHVDDAALTNTRGGFAVCLCIYQDAPEGKHGGITTYPDCKHSNQDCRGGICTCQYTTKDYFLKEFESIIIPYGVYHKSINPGIGQMFTYVAFFELIPSAEKVSPAKGLRKLADDVRKRFPVRKFTADSFVNALSKRNVPF